MASLRSTLALFAFAVMALGKNVDHSCDLSSWTDWGPCLSTEQQFYPDMPFSYPVPVTSMPDRGRAMMKHSMEHKTLSSYARRKCQAEGSCPEYNKRNSVFEESKCVDGFAGDFPCRNIDLLSNVNVDDLGYTQDVQYDIGDYMPGGNDIWGWTDPDTGKEYAIIGLTGGTSFVDVTNPTNPKVVAFLMSKTGSAPWRDIKVARNTAYIVAEVFHHGMQVFDLTRLRDLDEMTYVDADYTYTYNSNSHNLVASEDDRFLYIVGSTESRFNWFKACSGGLHIVDISNPLLPEFVGCFDEDGYVHDAHCVFYHGPDVRYQNHEVCLCFNEDSLTIVDMSDKTNMTIISKSGYNFAMYTHQGWLTEDHTTLLLDDEWDEKYFVSPDKSRLGHTVTYMWDVRDLQAPQLKSHYISTEQAIDHNQYVVGDLTFQSNYAAGLRVLHIDQENYALKEVAYFDCLPTNQVKPNFEGSWSNYPFFKSGNIIFSSIEHGLFVVSLDKEGVSRAVDDVTEYWQQSRTRSITRARRDVTCEPATMTRQCPKV